MIGVLEFYAAHMPDKRSLHCIYDIGSGRGNLLACLRKEGYTAYGCEPSAELTKRAREVYGLGPRVLSCETASEFLFRRSKSIGKVDVIFMWHVLEHVDNTVELLRAAAAHLSPTGVIIAQGPLLAPEYVYPAHRFFHSESNIVWLARTTGLKLLMIECQNPERFASFVFGAATHPQAAAQSVFLDEPLAAVGSLFFTLSFALRRLKARLSMSSENRNKQVP